MTGLTVLLPALTGAGIDAAGSPALTDGAGITIVGMLTVFVGLATLTLLLPLLRRLVERDEGRRGPAVDGAAAESRGLTHAEVVAIGTAIYAHLCMHEQKESMKLTWEDHDKPYTPWRLAGRAEHLSGLETVQSRIRSR